MPRTPFERELTARLAALNNQLCFFAFAEWEVNRAIGRFAVTVNDRRSTELFADNPLAPRINLRLSELRDVQAVNRGFTFGAMFATSYEVAAQYYDLATKFLGDIGQKPLVVSKDNRPEIAFQSTLTDSGLQPPSQPVVDTMRYMRLRRNHFIHIGDTLTSDFRDLITQRGRSVNDYWGDTRDCVDFSSIDVDQFTEAESIALIKLIRISLKHFDECVWGSVSTPRLVAQKAAELVAGRSRLNADVVEKLSSTLVGSLKQTFGLDVAPASARAAVKAVP